MQLDPMPEATFWNMDLWIVVGLLLYAWVVQRYFRQISVLCEALFNLRNFDKPVRSAFRDGDIPSAWANALFFCLSLTSYSWWFWLVCAREVFPELPLLGEHPWMGWTRGQVLIVLSLALVLVWYAVKYVLSRVVAAVFDEARFASFYWKTGLYYDLAFSLVCLPVIALCMRLEGSWLKGILVALFVVWCMCLIIKMLRFVLEGKEYSRFSPLHIFVYLCGLEILPFVCFWQIFCGL